MTGVRRDTVTVDVVAAARQLLESKSGSEPEAGTVPVEKSERSVDVFGSISQPGSARVPSHRSGSGGSESSVGSERACALGHGNAAGARFCVSCGLPMDAPPPVTVPAERPRPVAALSAEERRERDRQHAEALAANLRAEQDVPDLATQEDPSERKLRIHFVSEGFTFGGRVWHVGDELEIGPDHPRWPQAVPWILLTRREQAERYGKVFFDVGPWPYGRPEPGTEMQLPVLGEDRLFEMRRRQGAVPPAREGENNSLIPL